jgi:hypothetical protein
MLPYHAVNVEIVVVLVITESVCKLIALARWCILTKPGDAVLGEIEDR